MKEKHLTFERIVEFLNGVSDLTEVEQIHLENCQLCKNRIESAGYLDKGVKESLKAEPIMDLDHIESLADAVFDKCYEKDHTGFRKWIVFAGSGAIAASILIAVYFFNDFNKNNTFETASKEDTASQQTEEKATESGENEIPKGVSKITKGSLIAEENYELTAVTDSMIVHEYENYFSVMKGTVEFRVRTGTEFMVNLNNSALIRVLGTVFKVTVDKKGSSVEVSEGLVEVIDLRKGTSSTVSKGDSAHIRNLAKAEKRIVDAISEKIVRQTEIIEEIKEDTAIIEKRSDTSFNFNVNGDTDLIKAEISDLETALQYSGSPVVQLHRLFELYRITGHWGSIIHFWRTEATEIDSRGNPFLKDMHFAACEASIKMFLYDNEVCRKYRASYPDGPDPDGMEDHLRMAW